MNDTPELFSITGISKATKDGEFLRPFHCNAHVYYQLIGMHLTKYHKLFSPAQIVFERLTEDKIERFIKQCVNMAWFLDKNGLSFLRERDPAYSCFVNMSYVGSFKDDRFLEKKEDGNASVIIDMALFVTEKGPEILIAVNVIENRFTEEKFECISCFWDRSYGDALKEKVEYLPGGIKWQQDATDGDGRLILPEDIPPPEIDMFDMPLYVNVPVLREYLSTKYGM